ncbi:MAG: Ig-like domain-containing protein, partial [bacterium]
MDRVRVLRRWSKTHGQRSAHFVSSPVAGGGSLRARIDGWCTPNAGYRGAESFTYRVRDSLRLFSNDATVQLRVNSEPNTTADSLVVKQTITTVLDVLRNDSDP